MNEESELLVPISDNVPICFPKEEDKDENKMNNLPEKWEIAAKISQLDDYSLQEVVQLIQANSPSTVKDKNEQWTFDLNELDQKTLYILQQFVTTYFENLAMLNELPQQLDEIKAEEIQWQEFQENFLEPLPFLDQPFLDTTFQDQLLIEQPTLPQKRKETEERPLSEESSAKKIRSYMEEVTAGEPADSTNDDKLFQPYQIGPSGVANQTTIVPSSTGEKKTIKIKIQIYRVEKSHPGPKPYTCDGKGCSKTFADSSNLLKHIRTHTMEKPYVCPFEGCWKSFAYSSILKEHINIHFGAKPFICNFEGCGKSFAQNSNLRRHMRLHTGERPYACDKCGKKYAQSSNLKQHLRIHTKNRQIGEIE